MKYTFDIDIDEKVYGTFKKILKQENATPSDLFEILIHKTVSENNIDWIYTSVIGEVRSKNIKNRKAIELFRKRGHGVNSYNTTFASKNTGHNVYWSNPDKRHLKEDWYIILNDNINNILYLLYIPANNIQNLIMRNNRECNVSIQYNDMTFTDKNSNTSFGKYLVDKIEYGSLF